MSLTLEERATNFDTMCHIERVRNLLNDVIREILLRQEAHDQTKLDPPEVGLFSEYTKSLSTLTYGSPEYNQKLAELKPALDHHYANNRHHPEYHKDGVNDMNLIDLIEMFCDWKAASERHQDGDIIRSIELNVDRFGLSPQLAKILENTARDTNLI